MPKIIHPIGVYKQNVEPEIKDTDAPSKLAINRLLLKARFICPYCFILRIVLVLCFIVGLYIIF